jgi:UDP-N-acetylmuramoyl-L-alanyl-D-glutamate--2,6-diaminopimelate ligase
MITTLGAEIDGEKFTHDLHVTTPAAWTLQKYLRHAKNKGVTHVALEVSSHSLDQYRVIGIPFAVGVLTNITHEHLDYHKTYENYVRTKAKLLQRAKVAIINRDDESYTHVLKYLSSKIPQTYSLHNPEATITLDNFPFTTQLIGGFNLYNSLAAALTTRTVGIDDGTIKKALGTFTAPTGRQEIIYDKEFKVISDFAHTPNGFEKLLPALKKITSNRLIHVFGCVSKRDDSNRPLMGKASSDYADVIILTADDPRGESIQKINQEIRRDISGFNVITKEEYRPGMKKVIIEIDRREQAIAFAIQIAEPGDTIVSTGKSHEKGMNYDGVYEEEWDETMALKKALQDRGMKV